MPTLLCLETATNVCSVALTEDENILAFREINEGYRHAEKITVFINEVLEEAGKKLSDIDAVAVSNGPGSYTGLRIGASVAKGLCLAIDKPVIAISTLEAMALKVFKQVEKKDENFLLCPMIDAGRMEVYTALYDQKFKCLQLPQAVIVDELFLSDKNFKTFYFGDGAAKCKTVLDSSKFIFLENILPSAKSMTSIALEKFKNEEFENLALFEPFYLKEYVAGRKSS